jgi:hypothetical protein
VRLVDHQRLVARPCRRLQRCGGGPPTRQGSSSIRFLTASSCCPGTGTAPVRPCDVMLTCFARTRAGPDRRAGGLRARTWSRGPHADAAPALQRPGWGGNVCRGEQSDEPSARKRPRANGLGDVAGRCVAACVLAQRVREFLGRRPLFPLT